MITNNLLKYRKGFTPTPILVLFSFLKTLPLVAVTSVQEFISAKNDGETKKSHQNWCRGFTLIETLVAISILLIAVVGPISLIGDALHKLYFAKDEMVAINLAQEGIEVVRQRRDSNMLAASPSDFFSYGAGTTLYYTIDATPATLNLSTNAQQPVYLNNGFYEQGTSAAPTQFKRLVSVSNMGLPETREVKVTSTVTWNTGNTPGTVTVTEYLFKWAI